MKKTIGNYTLNTSGSMIIIRKNGELINASEGNPNDMKESFNAKCKTVSTYVARLKSKA